MTVVDPRTATEIASVRLADRTDVDTAVAAARAALAAGCPVILKPAETTPLSAIHLTQAIHDAGVPAG